ncbi:MAG: hypothetical protein RIC38_16055, partial [Chromatocurvus sp.]
VVAAVEQIIRRYGLGYVSSRAVLLFDISDFSLRTPFEQASQLNSLSYSMNSVYNKLAARGMEINFARTTTGDGYYVWNRDREDDSDSLLFYFLVLIMLDNALASRASRGKTVPLIRAAFDIGSHYELYQAEGVNPTVFSYIVGDVTIDLARMIEKAGPGQILLGNFASEATVSGEVVDPVARGTPAFVAASDSGFERIQGIKMMGSVIEDISCWLTASRPLAPRHDSPLELALTDKHGFSHLAYNLEIAASLGDVQMRLGHSPEQLRARSQR